jgi:hypothetical protein
LLVALAAALICLAAPGAAVAAEPCASPFVGVMTFPAIEGENDSGEFCWELELGANQGLRQIDDHEAEVFYVTPEHRAFTITTELAHDAEGTDVPTTISVVQPNVIVLSVHHQPDDPLAAGAPFQYPVTPGAGWEGGFFSEEIKGPPDEAELKAMAKPSPAPVEEPPTPTCEVPVLQGRTVKSARRALLASGCQLGPIRGRRHPGARIVKQYRPAYKVLPAGTEVGVRLAR